MKFNILTIFPELYEPFLNSSLIEKGIKAKKIKVKLYNLRDFASDKHKTVDDKPFGGGRGMVMKADVVSKALKKIKGRVIVFSPRGKKFNQKMAYRFSKMKELVLVSARYEGIDERVLKHLADEVVSIGDYVLMGGDVASLVVLEAVSRIIPGVIGKQELVKQRIKKGGFIEYPQYTRPDVVSIKGKKRKVPQVLLSGNHKEIEKWRKDHSVIIE